MEVTLFTGSVGIPHTPQPDDVPSLWERGPGGNGLCPLSSLSASTEPPTPPVISGCRGQLSRWVTATHSPAGP